MKTSDLKMWAKRYLIGIACILLSLGLGSVIDDLTGVGLVYAWAIGVLAVVGLPIIGLMFETMLED